MVVVVGMLLPAAVAREKAGIMERWCCPLCLCVCVGMSFASSHLIIIIRLEGAMLVPATTPACHRVGTT